MKGSKANLEVTGQPHVSKTVIYKWSGFIAVLVKKAFTFLKIKIIKKCLQNKAFATSLLYHSNLIAHEYVTSATPIVAIDAGSMYIQKAHFLKDC